MGKLKTALAFALALFATTPLAQTGIYIVGGVGLGQAKFNGTDFPVEATFNRALDEKDTTWNIGVGYRFHPNAAVELGYASLGKYSARYTGFGPSAGDSSRDDYEVTAWKLAAVGQFPLAQGFSILGKLGFAASKAEDEFTDVTGGTTTVSHPKKSKTKLLWGVGAQYDFMRNIGLRLEYENFGEVGAGFTNSGNDANEPGRAKISTINLNLVYSFQ